jgi:hypothetical protein
MLVNVDGNVTSDSLLQPLKTDAPILVILDGTTMLVSEAQLPNAEFPKLVKVDGRVTPESTEHEPNVLDPSEVTPSGNEILVSATQKLKADLPMLSVVMPVEIVTLVSFEQPENAKFPIEVTLAGIETSVRSVQLAKALVPILVTGSSSKLTGSVIVGGMVIGPSGGVTKPVMETVVPLSV